MKDSIFIHHRSSHHANNSGYSRLLDFSPQSKVIYGKPQLPYKIAKFISRNSNQDLGIYDSDSVLKDFELFKFLIKNRNQNRVVHYLNGERNLRYCLKYSRIFKNTKFYATFHKPPEILKLQFSNTTYLKKLNGVIAVGENQVEFLKNWLEIENVKYIPHGVDTDFFEPDYSKVKNNTLLFVGQHLRDFEAFNYCIPRIAEKVEGLKVNVIIRKDFNKFINPHASITIFNNINDFKLKAFYQKASILFLPLLNSTACNSILEAMACGLPIITTNVGGNLSYLENTKNVLVPRGDNDYLIEVTIDFLTNKDKLIEARSFSRDKSMSYKWDIIASQVNSFYQDYNK